MDFERNISSPAWKKAMPWENATSAEANQQRRMRFSMLSSAADFMMTCTSQSTLTSASMHEVPKNLV